MWNTKLQNSCWVIYPENKPEASFLCWRQCKESCYMWSAGFFLHSLPSSAVHSRSPFPLSEVCSDAQSFQASEKLPDVDCSALHSTVEPTEKKKKTLYRSPSQPKSWKSPLLHLACLFSKSPPWGWTDISMKHTEMLSNCHPPPLVSHITLHDAWFSYR